MNSITRWPQKCFWQIYGMIMFGCIIGYLLLIGGKDIWYDEAYTFGLIRHSYREICFITAADVHPPLYYILLK